MYLPVHTFRNKLFFVTGPALTSVQKLLYKNEDWSFPLHVLDFPLQKAYLMMEKRRLGIFRAFSPSFPFLAFGQSKKWRGNDKSSASYTSH